MAGLARCCTCTSVLLAVCSLVFVLALFLLPCMPPYVHFPEYTGVAPEPLSQSSEVLNGVEHMRTGELRGPEALALRTSAKLGTQLFTGLLGGRVVRIDLDDPGANVTTVTRLGHEACESEVEGERCGRPMGMQFHADGMLYVLDAYHGLYRVDVDTGSYEHLAGGPQQIGGQRVRLACDLAVASDGRVFWSDASTQAGPEDVLLELLAQPSGRLLRYNPVTNHSEALIGGVHCATGVVLARDESFVLVAEAGKDRILRYHLKGPQAGKWDVFSEGLPGVPAKIRRGGPGGEDGFLVTLALTHPSALHWLRRHPALGRAMMRLLAATEAVFSAVNGLVSNHVSRDALYMLGNPQLVAPLLHGGVVLALNSSGHVIGALRSGDGSAGMISQLEPAGQFVYLASPYNPFLGRLNLTDELRLMLGSDPEERSGVEGLQIEAKVTGVVYKKVSQVEKASKFETEAKVEGMSQDLEERVTGVVYKNQTRPTGSSKEEIIQELENQEPENQERNDLEPEDQRPESQEREILETKVQNPEHQEQENQKPEDLKPKDEEARNQEPEKQEPKDQELEDQEREVRVTGVVYKNQTRMTGSSKETTTQEPEIRVTGATTQGAEVRLTGDTTEEPEDSTEDWITDKDFTDEAQTTSAREDTTLSNQVEEFTQREPIKLLSLKDLLSGQV